MDSPDIAPDLFVGSLSGLRRVNYVTRSARILWPDIARLALQAPGRPLRILDVACGGGDTLIRIGRLARRAGMAVDLAGCDIKSLAVDYAFESAQRAGVRADFFTLDATRDPFPVDRDVIMSSLFLHHLDGDVAAGFLRRAAGATTRLLLMQDLVRSHAGYTLAAVGTPLLLCNHVCRKDGPASVQAAFSLSEARDLADRAGLSAARVEPRFPFRFLLRWERP